VVADAGTDNLKAPLTSVMAPIVVPFEVTDAPIKGDPSFESVTLPETILFWAMAGIAKKQHKIKQLTLSKFLKYIKLGLMVCLLVE